MSQNQLWIPPTPEQDLAETNFENNPALADEVARDSLAWAKTVEPESYEVSGGVAEVTSETVAGFMEAKREL